MAREYIPNSINYIEFYFSNQEEIAAAKVFYQKLFGWTFNEMSPAYVNFRAGHVHGAFRIGAQGAAQNPVVGIYVKDLERALKDVEALGAEIVQKTFSFPGGRRFEFQDPWGIRMGVFCRDC